MSQTKDPRSCPECGGEGAKATRRRDDAGRYEVRELCMACVGWGKVSQVACWICTEPFTDKAPVARFEREGTPGGHYGPICVPCAVFLDADAVREAAGLPHPHICCGERCWCRSVEGQANAEASRAEVKALLSEVFS